MRVVIPTGVMNSFKGICGPYSLVAIVASEKFDEDKTIRMELDDPRVPYHWSK
jgi:dTDP-4-dehydrorhamnose 3,5-epimerase-like enzyme